MRYPLIHVRIPPAAKAWLIKQAKKHERTMNSQVVFLIKNAMKKEASETSLQALSDASEQ